MSDRKRSFVGAGLLLVGWVALLVLLAVAHSYSTQPVQAKPEATVTIFVAEWCTKCPTEADIEQARRDYPHVTFEVVDVDKRPDLKQKYHVTRVPFAVLCTEGQCLPTMDMNELQNWLDHGLAMWPRSGSKYYLGDGK
jgi:thioredoxin-like negative regulator of GroEL